jgi:tRNA threonylcarbamoyl adenosine modification protein (Sua5/YciO/YrdC/YwlC family)
MSERVSVNVHGPKPREIDRVTSVLVRGGLIAYPTDSGYALGWRTDNKAARDRVIRLRQLNRDHHFTFCCRSLSDVGQLTRVNNQAHRLIRQLTPGPYTFILPATSQVPRSVKHRQQTIGVRIPDNAVVRALLESLDEPLLSSSLILPDQEEIFDSEDLFDAVYGSIDLFVDSGYCALEPTTLVDLSGDTPVILRHGAGEVDFL